MKSNGDAFKIGDGVRIISVEYKYADSDFNANGCVGIIESFDKTDGSFWVFSNEVADWFMPEEMEHYFIQSDFNKLTPEERKQFIRSLSEQLFTNPRAYVEYNKVYLSLK